MWMSLALIFGVWDLALLWLWLRERRAHHGLRAFVCEEIRARRVAEARFAALVDSNARAKLHAVTGGAA